MAGGLTEFITRSPKVELHVHLEGAIEPAMLLRLAGRRRLDLPASSEDELREWFRFRDFEHFIDVYVRCSRCLRDPEDFQDLVSSFLIAQARQNIAYCEAHFTISTHIAHGVNGDEVADAMWQAIQRGEADHGVRLRLIPDIVRNVDPRRADWTLEWALENRARGVVAIGLSGVERYPDEPFHEHLQAAADQGLHRSIHAGEHCGPESVWAAIERCAAERIGHGIRSVDDPELLVELCERQLPLEICPTSNLRLGAATSLENHPLGQLVDAGVALTINTDDPAFFGVSLTEELVGVAEAFGYGADEIAAFGLAGIDHAFLPPEEKARLSEDFRRQYVELGERYLGRPVEPVSLQAIKN